MLDRVVSSYSPTLRALAEARTRPRPTSPGLADPTLGGLIPYDWATAGLVGVRDLSANEHPGGEFIFLSACKTATGGIANLDEAINLTAALHYAGWRHVIGTLWFVWDISAADITRGVYSYLVQDGYLDSTHSAEALHRTLRDYRDQHCYQPSRWTPFLHTGP